jgi:AraC family transcriptional regulator, regulatory protein of adaptative response / methylated-DNA-[protein]-cysteine methyltransferase
MFDKPNIVEAPAGQDPRWRAVALRDRTFDGQFYYAVKTTGVYCRPSCAARAARPENVSFYASCEDAERAGFRPCKRCKPNEMSLVAQNAAKVAEICRVIETAPQIPSLNAMAGRAGLSPSHFHRLFKTITGVTPRAYAPIVPSVSGRRLPSLIRRSPKRSIARGSIQAEGSTKPQTRCWA